MLVFVHLDDSVQALFEGVPVCGETHYGQYKVGRLLNGAILFVIVLADSEDLWYEARIDVVARCGSCIACEDAEVGAGDA